MSDLQHHRACLILLVAANASLVACGSIDGVSLSGVRDTVTGMATPYKMDIVQGNFVSKEQVEAIKPGMSRTQVRDVMGTPLLTSVFHGDRWDYVFTFKRQGVEPQSRRVTVFFKGDSLERIEADALPTEAEFVASLDSGQGTGKVPVLMMTQEGLDQLPAPAKNTDPKAMVTPLPAATPSRYPPLEPAGN